MGELKNCYCGESCNASNLIYLDADETIGYVEYLCDVCGFSTGEISFENNDTEPAIKEAERRWNTRQPDPCQGLGNSASIF